MRSTYLKRGIVLCWMSGAVLVGGLLRYAIAQNGGMHPKTGNLQRIDAAENSAKPDLSIALGNGMGSVGNNIINSSTAGQTLINSVASKSKTSYLVTLRNAGSDAGHFKLSVSRTVGSTVKYFSLDARGVATDITTPLIRAGYNIGSLSSGATARFRADVTLTNMDASSITFSAEAQPESRRIDRVKAVTQFVRPDFSLACKPTVLAIPVGQTRSVNVTVTGGEGYTGKVALTTALLPEGITSAFYPNIVHITNGGTATTKLNLTASSSALARDGSLTVRGTLLNGSNLRKEVPLHVSVTDFSLSTSAHDGLRLDQGHSADEQIYLNAINGYSGSVALTSSVTGTDGNSSSGITVQFTPTKLSSSTKSISQMKVGVSDTVMPGPYKITVSGTNTFDALTRSVDIILNVGTFSLAANPTSIDIPAGQQKSVNVSAKGANGAVSNVALSVTGMPAGMTVTTNANNILTIKVADSVVVGSYALTVSGKSGIRDEATTTVTVNVTNFVLSCSPFVIEANPGASGQARVSVVAKGNFTDTVNLTATCPEGVTASFNPVAISASQSGLLTLNLAEDVVPGTYPITITGTDQQPEGKPRHQLKIKLVVSNFTVSLAPTVVKVPVGSSKTAIAKFHSPGSFVGSLQVEFGDLPQGVTMTASPNSVQLAAGGTDTCTITVTAASTTKPGNYKVPIQAKSSTNQTASATLEVQVVDFELNATPEAITLSAGQSEPVYITADPLGMFTDDVVLSLSDAVEGIEATLDLSTIKPTNVATLDIKALATIAPGEHTLTITGTSGALTHMLAIKISVQTARHWIPGTSFQGGQIASPPLGTTVAPGVSIPIVLMLATDADHWTSADGKSGIEPDNVTYEWEWEDGNFVVSAEKTSGRWTAPRTPGVYTITCTIDDVAPEPELPDTGSRDDKKPIQATVTITVGDKSSHQVWTVGSAISGGEISAPRANQEVQKGATVQVVTDVALDLDHWQKVNEDDEVLDEGDEPDEVVYSWTCTSGGFIRKLDADGVPILSSTSSLASPKWVAPAIIPVSGTATLTLSIKDKVAPVVKPDTGERDDLQSLSHSVRLVIVNQVSQRVAKLQYSTGSLDESTAWLDVPNAGEQGYPLTVLQGDEVNFRAVKSLENQPWPDGLPTWGGEAGSGEYGEIVSVYFENASQSDSDLKKVTATCVNTKTAFVKVRKKYEMSITSKKDGILAGGETEDSQTTIKVSLSDYDGNVIPNAAVVLTSVYADASYQPTNNAAGILKGQNNGHPGGQLHRLRIRLDSNGEATVTLIAGVIPTFVADTFVNGTVEGDLTPVEVYPAQVAFEPPTATPKISDWLSNDETDLQEAECSFVIDYKGTQLAGRNIRVRVTKILHANGSPVAGANPVPWAHFVQENTISDQTGIIKARLVWTGNGLNPDDYDISYAVDDTAVLLPDEEDGN